MLLISAEIFRTADFADFQYTTDFFSRWCRWFTQRFLEPLISQITLILNKLQVLRIFTDKFLDAPFDKRREQRMNWQIGRRTKRNLLQNLLFNLLRIYSLPPWRNMIFRIANYTDYADFQQTTDKIVL